MKLKDARTLAKLSQAQLATISGTTQCNICIWERGLAKPQKRSRKRIENVLGFIDWGNSSTDGTEFELQQLDQNISDFNTQHPGQRLAMMRFLRQWLLFLWAVSND
jgi:transcriptional regulator with XRE-family HTH domain